MGALLETLTTPEAAVAAGVSVREVNRVVDEHILPDTLYSTEKMRRFRTDACLLIAFYFSTADRLTADARLRMIRNKLAHSPTWDGWQHWSIEDDLLTIHFDSLWKSVDQRLRDLLEARKLVVEDEEILSGTPVIRGTRVPVHDVAAALSAGTPKERILKAYPSLNERQVDLAAIYSKAVPPRGRPRRFSPPTGSRILTSKKQLRKSSLGE
jgi:uncharacterized protein (DUF433 family)